MPKFEKLFNLKNSYDLLSEMRPISYDYYTEVMNHGTMDMDNLRYFLLCLDRLYQEGFESPLRDNEYDEIHEYYIDQGGSVIRGDLSSTDKAVHAYPDLKGTIRKVHFITEADRKANGKVKSQKSLESWLITTMKTLSDSGIYDGTIDIGMYTKFDGLSVILEIEDGTLKSAITRGDKNTGEGQNKTGIFQFMDFDKECNSLGVSKFGMKCEALVAKSKFDAYNKRFGGGKLIDERTAATSIMNNDSPSSSQMEYLTLMPLMVEVNGVEYPLPVMDGNVPQEIEDTFNWLSDEFPACTMRINMNKLDVALDKIKKGIQLLEHSIEKLDYPVDGIVIRILNEDYRRALGRNTVDCVNNWERAYKFPPVQAKTVLTDVEQSIGFLGKVSFIAKVKPVKLKNKTIKSISIGSLDRFKSLDLAIGDEVIVQYDIIPYLTRDASCKRSNNHPIDVIVNCPVCGFSLHKVPELSCINPDCPSRVIGRIYNYCDKIGIEDIGPSTIERMVNDGLIRNISDLYKLTDKGLHDYGFGPVESKNIVKSIHRVREVTPGTLLGSMGIAGISKKTFEKVLKKIPFDTLLTMDTGTKELEKLCDIDGIKTKTASKLLLGLSLMRDEITEIAKHLDIKDAKDYAMLVCFTKVRDRDFEKYLQSMGVGVVDDVTKRTSILISGGGTSSKTEKANKLGIPVITLDEAYKRFNY